MSGMHFAASRAAGSRLWEARCVAARAARRNCICAGNASNWRTQCMRYNSTQTNGTIRIAGLTYPTDQWTNIPASIVSLAGRTPHLYDVRDHPISITKQLIEKQFGHGEYKNFEAPDPVVSVRDNFDVLGFPADHPGRSRTDTYYVNKDMVLRTHTSAHQAQHFKNMQGADGYTLTADVYRRDAIDRSHYPVFHQMEGARLWDRENAKRANTTLEKLILRDVSNLPTHDMEVEDVNPTFHPKRNPLQSDFHTPEEVEAIAMHLKRSLELLISRILSMARAAACSDPKHSLQQSAPLKVRWVEAYFPFTSPSWEVEVLWQDSWLELLGCGIVKQEILNNSSCASKVGWAWGIGLERIAMLLFGIPDIRLFWSQDSRFLSQFHSGQINSFRPFSRHPGASRDLAFWLSSSISSADNMGRGDPDSVHENDVMEIIRNVGGDLVEDVQLVDQFTHPKTSRKSLCYRIMYRSLEKTLVSSEVNSLHKRVGDALVKRLGVELR